VTVENTAGTRLRQVDDIGNEMAFLTIAQILIFSTVARSLMPTA